MGLDVVIVGTGGGSIQIGDNYNDNKVELSMNSCVEIEHKDRNGNVGKYLHGLISSEKIEKRNFQSHPN